MQHFIAINEFKLALQYQNPKFGSKVVIFVPCDFDVWPWKTIGHLAHATSNFLHHFIAMWIRTGVTVRKRLNVVLTSLTLTFDLWSWHFVPDHFCGHYYAMMATEWKGVTDRRTNGRTDWTIRRAAWSQLKINDDISHNLVSLRLVGKCIPNFCG